MARNDMKEDSKVTEPARTVTTRLYRVLPALLPPAPEDIIRQGADEEHTPWSQPRD